MAILNDIKADYCDIKYYRNDEFNRNISVLDETGSPVNLSGKVLVMQIKKNKNDPSTKALATLSSASEITISGTFNNVIIFSGLYDLAERAYFYDLENVTDNETIIYGKFIVTGDVTR